MNLELIKSFFRKTSVRTPMAILSFVWLLLSILFYAGYRTAYAHLQTNKPTELQNRSELKVFYAPLEVSVGDQFSPEDLTAYLDELGYDRIENAAHGSYAKTKSSVRFFPRSDIFVSAEIHFAKNRIGKIFAGENSVEKLELEPLPMRNFIKYVKDESLKPQLVRRVVLSPEAVPETLADAVTSAEDTRFFEHHGVDVFGIAYRVLTFRGGGSSITQQLIKNNVIKGSQEEFWQKFLGFLPETLQRKIMEIPFSLAAEEMLSKNEILAAYLSMIPLAASEGVEIHGVVSASQEYFGKSVSDLTVAESAAIAGIIHLPSVYVHAARNGNYEKLTARRNRILDLMRRNHPDKYSSEIIEQAKDETIKFVFASTNRTERPADAYSRVFAAYVAAHLPENIAELRRTETDLQIFTTLNYPLQKAATEISEKSLNEITKKVFAECVRQKGKNFKCENVKPQVSLVALEAETGNVLAMYGGNSLEFNFALAKRSPASAIKPFYYLKAIEEGIWNGKPFTPETVIDPDTDTVAFRPENNVGQKSTASVGLAKSYNFHAVAAAESVGIKKAVGFVGKLTNSNPEISGVSAIGGSKGAETSLLDLTSAYTVFCNSGISVKANPNKFYLLDGKKLPFPKTKSEKIASVESAVQTNEMMKQVLSENGTAPDFKRLANLSNSNEISAKTGSGMVADLWFFAVTPKIAVGVWVGLPENEINLEMNRNFTGGKSAAPIAAEFFRQSKEYKSPLM